MADYLENSSTESASSWNGASPIKSNEREEEEEKIIVEPEEEGEEETQEEEEEEEEIPTDAVSVPTQVRLSSLARSSTVAAADTASGSQDDEQSEVEAQNVQLDTKKEEKFEAVYGADNFENQEEENDEEDDESIEVIVKTKAAATNDDKIENWGFEKEAAKTASNVLFEEPVGAQKTTVDDDDFDDDDENALAEFVTSKVSLQENKDTAAVTPKSLAIHDLLSTKKPLVEEMKWSTADFFQLHNDTDKLMSTVASVLLKNGKPIDDAKRLLRASLNAIHDVYITGNAQNLDKYQNVFNTLGNASMPHEQTVQDTLKMYVMSVPSMSLSSSLSQQLANSESIPTIDAHAAIASKRFSVDQALTSLMTVAHVASYVLSSSDVDTEHTQWLSHMIKSSKVYCDAFNTCRTITPSQQQLATAKAYVTSPTSASSTPEPVKALSRLQRAALALKAKN